MSPTTASHEKASAEYTMLFGTFSIHPSTIQSFLWTVSLLGISFAVYVAYAFRLKAITEYGAVIHEFDPYFHRRATEYLLEHGWDKFFTWYDYLSWYPLGRPIGTTIYPGLQITAAVLYRILQRFGGNWAMTVNEVCCYLPAWFGSLATVLMALLTYECSGSLLSAVFASLIFSILPAHLMRTVGGGFDNEAIAISAMIATFYCWVRSLRETTRSWVYGIATGLCYGYMVAAWGGFIFVLNMISLHAMVVVFIDWLRGVYDRRVFLAYSLYCFIGTFLATCVPPVGVMPFKSLEQISSLVVWCLLATLHLSEYERQRRDIPIQSFRCVRLRFKYSIALSFAVMAVFVVLLPSGYWGPISSRVRGLFVAHMKTGNPLVDSVAEHQPGTPDAFWGFLHIVYYLAPWGFVVMFHHPLRQSSFPPILYLVVQFFALTMSRLLILASIPHALLGGIALGLTIESLLEDACIPLAHLSPTTPHRRNERKSMGRKSSSSAFANFSGWLFHWRSPTWRKIRGALFFLFLFHVLSGARSFVRHAEKMRDTISHTSLVFKHREGEQETVIDDYRDGYEFLRTETPADSRILAWWDYGYQIAGMGNRTTLADGNTWNHEHIAMVGRCLTAPVAQAHRMIRHLADYVLVWSGGGGDDLAKAPWMARIGNSVYRDICPNDPLCEKFGFYPKEGIMEWSQADPTPMMAKSLLYNLHMADRRPGVGPDPELFEEVFRSKYGLLRIFKVMNISQESKDWVRDSKNRICDPPGSWLCAGQYPPAEELQEVLRKAINFKQLEDFNRKQMEQQDNFGEQYHRRSVHEKLI